MRAAQWVVGRLSGLGIPGLGEHTAEVLEEAGFAAKEIEAYLAEKKS
jgi:crotonobetainyl-CoA:carnitine CoA-transferase CaiB-like acyl-CoA transferase